MFLSGMNRTNATSSTVNRDSNAVLPFRSIDGSCVHLLIANCANWNEGSESPGVIYSRPSSRWLVWWMIDYSLFAINLGEWNNGAGGVPAVIHHWDGCDWTSQRAVSGNQLQHVKGRSSAVHCSHCLTFLCEIAKNLYRRENLSWACLIGNIPGSLPEQEESCNTAFRNSLAGARWSKPPHQNEKRMAQNSHFRFCWVKPSDQPRQQ